MTRRAGPAGAVALGAAALGIATLAVAGCSPGGGPAPSDPASVSRPPAATPAATARAATPGATPVEPAGTPSAGLLAAGAAVPGVLGSWSLDDRGAASPWIPAGALEAFDLPPGITPSVSFAAAAPIGTWQAVYAPASDPAGVTLAGAGGRGVDRPAIVSAVLDPLPAGEWVLVVRLFRADGRGEATFFWLVRVP